MPVRIPAPARRARADTFDYVPEIVPITCGHCDTAVAANVVAGSPTGQAWLQCPSCGSGSVRVPHPAGGPCAIFPGALPGQAVSNLPVDVATAWTEARSAFGAGAFTAAEIMCRKILMHLAVDVAASEPGRHFTDYVDALEGTGYITTGLKPVVDSIRERGNVANHDLPASTSEDARTTLTITEHLLRSVYELPGLLAPPPKAD